MARGDHITASRWLYTHHGVDLGDGLVAHYSGLAHGLRAGPVEVVQMEDFTRGAKLRTVRHRRRLAVQETIERVLGRIGEDQYHVIFNNCEHFAHWAVTGERRSLQVSRALAAAALVAVAATGLGVRARLTGGEASA